MYLILIFVVENVVIDLESFCNYVLRIIVIIDDVLFLVRKNLDFYSIMEEFVDEL